MIMQDIIKIVVPILVGIAGFSINQFNQLGVISSKLDNLTVLVKEGADERKEIKNEIQTLKNKTTVDSYRIDKLEEGRRGP